MREPALRFSTDLLLAAQDVRVLFFDVDGVLTDGSVYFTEHGESLKRFNVQDGYGLKLLARAGVTPVVITGRDSQALRARLTGLGITHAHFGVDDKLAVAEQELAALGVAWTQAAGIGDDWPDLPVLTRCAFSAAPADAHAEVRASVRMVTRARGGEGAARELCDLLLTARGQYARALEAARQAPLP